MYCAPRGPVDSSRIFTGALFALARGMLIPAIVLITGLCMMLVERLRSGHDLPKSRGWWPRAIAASSVQALIVVFAAPLWDPWLEAHPLLPGARLGTVAGALVGYVVVTFVYYFWHRARHEVPLLWRVFHQLHHSPTRIEVVASFYKHPAEILVNGVLSSSILYGLCGLSVQAAAIATLMTGLAELVYHWNVRTPRWLGYFFQRPEMHRLHHAEGVHGYNYSDLPLWDLIFGTFRNPARCEAPTGFGGDHELRLGEMLRGRDLFAPPPPRTRERRWAAALLLIGSLQMVGDVLDQPLLVGLGAATNASPAPKVFTTVGDAEPFSSHFALELEGIDGEVRVVPLTPDRYRDLRGPYNRRNVYGAVIAGGPQMHALPHVGPMMEAAAHHALCGEAPLLREIGESPATATTIVQRARDGSITRWRIAC